MSYVETSTEMLTYGRGDLEEALLELEFTHGISQLQYIVVGGASLVLRGIRNRTQDLDILVSADAHESLLSSGAEIKDLPAAAIERGDTNTTLGMYLSKNRVPLSATTHLPGNGTHPMSFDTVRQTAELVRSTPCLSIEEMIASKSALRRAKDIADLELLRTKLGVYIPPLQSATPYSNQDAYITGDQKQPSPARYF